MEAIKQEEGTHSKGFRGNWIANCFLKIEYKIGIIDMPALNSDLNSTKESVGRIRSEIFLVVHKSQIGPAFFLLQHELKKNYPTKIIPFPT